MESPDSRRLTEEDELILNEINDLESSIVNVATYSNQIYLLLSRLFFIYHFIKDCEGRKRLAIETSHVYCGSYSAFSAMIEEVKSIIQSCASAENWMMRVEKRVDDVDRIQNITRCLNDYARKMMLPKFESMFACAYLDSFVEHMDNMATIKFVNEAKMFLASQKKVDSVAMQRAESASNSFIMLETYCKPGYRKYVCDCGHLNSGYKRLLGKFGNLGQVGKFAQFKVPNLTLMTSGEVAPDSEAEEKITEGFGSTFREVWHGALVAVKHVPVRQFTHGMHGMREAVVLSQGVEHMPSIPIASTSATSGGQASTQPQQQPQKRLSIVETLEKLKRDAQACMCLSPVLGACVHAGIGYFTTQLAPFGSLHDMLELSASCPSVTRNKTGENFFVNEKYLTAYHKVSILTDVITGIAFLHDKAISHGRLKTSNVLLFENCRAKLCDYGMKGYLTSSGREVTVGVDGQRWRTPEDIQYDTTLKEFRSKYIERSEALVKSGQPPLPMNIVGFQRNSMYPSMAIPAAEDIYCFGLLTICVLAEVPRPFNNVSWSEGVHAILQRGEKPRLASTFVDKPILSPLESIVDKCTQDVHHRPAASSMLTALDELLRDVAMLGLQEERKTQENLLNSVVKEIAAYDKKINDTTTMISKGRELIDKKEMEVYKVTDPKERKNSQLALIRARTKLTSFEADRDGYKRDLEGAHADRLELERRLATAQRRLDTGRSGCLETIGRVWDRSYNQELLLDRYCTLEERKQVETQVIEGALKDFVESQLSLPFESNNDDFDDLDEDYDPNFKSDNHHSLLGNLNIVGTGLTDLLHTSAAVPQLFSSLLLSSTTATSGDGSKPAEGSLTNRKSMDADKINGKDGHNSWSLSSVFGFSSAPQETPKTVDLNGEEEEDGDNDVENGDKPSFKIPQYPLELKQPQQRIPSIVVDADGNRIIDKDYCSPIGGEDDVIDSDEDPIEARIGGFSPKGNIQNSSPNSKDQMTNNSNNNLGNLKNSNYSPSYHVDDQQPQTNTSTSTSKFPVFTQIVMSPEEIDSDEDEEFVRRISMEKVKR